MSGSGYAVCAAALLSRLMAKRHRERSVATLMTQGAKSKSRLAVTGFYKARDDIVRMLP